jgi:hypothetical protein
MKIARLYRSGYGAPWEALASTAANAKEANIHVERREIRNPCVNIVSEHPFGPFEAKFRQDESGPCST